MVYDNIAVEATREKTPAEDEEGMSWTECDEGGEGDYVDEEMQDDEDGEMMD